MGFESLVLLGLVGAAGGIGAVLRSLFKNPSEAWMPWGTLTANTVATFLPFLALKVFGLAVHDSGSGWGSGSASGASLIASFLTYALMVGLAGGMSTLSAVAGQVAELLRKRAWLRAIAYSVASLVLPSTAALLVNALI